MTRIHFRFRVRPLFPVKRNLSLLSLHGPETAETCVVCIIARSLAPVRKSFHRRPNNIDYWKQSSIEKIS